MDYFDMISNCHLFPKYAFLILSVPYFVCAFIILPIRIMRDPAWAMFQIIFQGMRIPMMKIFNVEITILERHIYVNITLLELLLSVIL